MPSPGWSEDATSTDDPPSVITVTDTWSSPSSRQAAPHSLSRLRATSGTTLDSESRAARVCSRSPSPWSSVTR